MDDDESSRLAYFAAMVAMYGSLDNWSQEILDMVQVLARIACGGLFRRFMVAFQSWPFKLAEVVDRSLSQDERHAVAEDFMDASDFCLDQFFSKPFRDSLTGIQDFFEQGMQDFLHSLFAQSACATTNLENGFSAMRHYLVMCWRPPSMATLACFHTSHTLNCVHRRWVKLMEGARKKYHSPNKCRPVWACTKRSLGQRSDGEKGRKVTTQNMHMAQRVAEIRCTDVRQPSEDENAYRIRVFGQAAQEVVIWTH